MCFKTQQCWTPTHLDLRGGLSRAANRGGRTLWVQRNPYCFPIQDLSMIDVEFLRLRFHWGFLEDSSRFKRSLGSAAISDSVLLHSGATRRRVPPPDQLNEYKFLLSRLGKQPF